MEYLRCMPGGRLSSITADAMYYNIASWLIWLVVHNPMNSCRQSQRWSSTGLHWRVAKIKLNGVEMHDAVCPNADSKKTLR